MTEPGTGNALTVVPPLGCYLWVQNVDVSPQYFTQTGRDGSPVIISVGPGQVVCYGPFTRHAEFACALSPAIRMDALPEGSEPEGLADEPLRLKPLDFAAP